LLVFLMEHPERSFLTDDLIVRLWSGQVKVDSKARCLIRSQVRHIRRAIEDGTGPWLVSELKGRGYGLWICPPVLRAEQLLARA
jgi:DNA-binding winged helix-turn-helix (wHTH) protein